MTEKKPIKVLQMAPLGSGGVTSLILNIAEAMDREAVEFDYLTFFDRTEFAEERALKCGGKKYVVPIDHFRNPVIRAFFKFFDSIIEIHKCKPDILHLNTSDHYDAVIALAAKLAGTKKVILHSHNSSSESKTGIAAVVYPLLKKLINALSDCNLACSEIAAEYMFTDAVLSAHDYRIIRNGIHTKRFEFSDAARREVRNQLGMQGNIIIGHIGRFTEQKNHKFLIDIFEEIFRAEPKARLLLIGQGELEEKIRFYAAQSLARDAIVFYGTSSRIPEMLQAMDCFLLPSLYEGLPVAAVEAQAAGLPTILSDTITKEVDITQLVAYVPLDASPEQWAKTVLGSIRSTEGRSQWAEAVKNAGFDIQETADEITKIYQSLV